MFTFWQYRSYTSFSRQFYNYFDTHCPKKKCIIELHKLANFQWDHAYFFDKRNQNIVQKITGLNVTFDPSASDTDTKVIFVKNRKIIKSGYIVSDLINKYQAKYNLFSSVKWIDVNFWGAKYSATKQQWIHYETIHYDLTPNNDKLDISYSSYLPSGTEYDSSLNERYRIYPTNEQQIYKKEQSND